mgnify:CR=1 FL=1
MTTKEELYLRACAGKDEFESEVQADAYLDWLLSRPGFRQYRKMNTYKCRFCGNWHTGGTDK